MREGPDAGSRKNRTADVSGKEAAEAALRVSEERFRALSKISSDWYWETDVDHRFTFMSFDVSFDRRTTRAQILGKTRWELFPNMMTPQEWEMHQQTLAARRPFQDILTRAFNPEGTEVIGYFSISGHPRYDAQGVFIGYQGIGRDVTRIKRAEQAIAESEARFRLIAQNTRDIVVLMQTNGKTIYVSPSYSRVTGYDIDASLRADPADLFHPDDLSALRRNFARCVVGDGQLATMSYRFRHADGRYIWLESQMHLVRDEHGLPGNVQISTRDISLRQEAELALERKAQELREANAALEVEIRSRQELERNILLAIEMGLEQVGLEVHDELGQNLTGIALLTKTLSQKLAEKSLDEAGLARRISELVNRAIGHTRMIAHGLSPYIWGNDGLVAALSQLANDVNSLGTVRCETRIPGAVAITDKVVVLTLYRVAQEAVNNALKHSKASQICIALKKTPRGIQLAISDNGVGRPPPDDGAHSRHGLHSIRHRCRAIDATLSIGDGKTGGTIVTVNWRGVDARNPIAKVSVKEAN
jgi:PAS domain S-box-containing protein